MFLIAKQVSFCGLIGKIVSEFSLKFDFAARFWQNEGAGYAEGRVMEYSISGAPRPQQNLLSEPRWELIPLKGVELQLASLPPRSKVTVTCSPAKGLSATLDLVEKVVKAGHWAIPHLSARMVESELSLRSSLKRLSALGVSEVFVVGGDQVEPLGPYSDSFSLLKALRALDVGPDFIGITGYPEGHPKIPDEVLLSDLERKNELADYIVTQMCFDVARIGEWVGELREREIDLPVYAGIPGAVDMVRLTKIAASIGVGASLRFLKGNFKTVARLMSGYDPTELVEELEGHDVAGVHIYTFNKVGKTETWRQSVLAG